MKSRSKKRKKKKNLKRKQGKIENHRNYITEKDLAALKYEPEEIRKKTKKIYLEIISESENIDKGNFSAIAPADLYYMFKLYDLYFFGGFFGRNYKDKVFFRFSRRMTRSAGKVEFGKDEIFTMVLSADLFFQSFGEVKREIKVNGVVCRNRLEALMRVFEHEVIHIVERIIFKTSDCKGEYFKILAYNIFGHTDTGHDLVVQAERAEKKFSLKVGDEVSFEYNGEVCYGVISRITKRATVMVRNLNGCYADKDGHRYHKIYVPLPFLKSVKK